MRTKSNMVGSGSSARISRRSFVSCCLLAPAYLSVLAGGGCSSKTATPIRSIEDLNQPSMIICGETECVSLRMGQERLPKAQFVSFATPADCYAALLAGKVDAVAYDRPPLEYAAADNELFYVMPDSLGEGHIAVGAPFKNRELMDKVNEFIKQYREDGTYQQMYDRWVKTINPQMPDIPKPENPINAGNPLIIGNDPQNIPMSFVNGDGRWSGFDTEFVQRLALFLNMDYQFESLYYDALFPAVESEKLDLAVGNLDKTPERAETMLFSDDYIDCPAGLMILKSRWQGPTDAAPAAPAAPAEAEAESNETDAAASEKTEEEQAN